MSRPAPDEEVAFTGARALPRPAGTRAVDPAHSRASAAIVLAAIAAHGVLTVVLALARYATVHNRTFDLALYARLAWGLVHGEAWDPIVGGSFLGGHVPWVLAPLGLLGRALGGTVPVLLVTQSACVALAAWPVSVVAARRFGPAGGVAGALAYLLYPNLGHVATYEFHPGTLALLPLTWALAALDRPAAPHARRGLVLGCALALACRLSLALQTVLIGALALRAGPALRRAGAAIAAFSVAYFLLSLLWLQPAFGQAASAAADLHFGKWGGSPFGALRALVAAPGTVFDHLLAPQRLSYLPRVLAPLAFLPLLAPRWLLVALPPLALNLLSEFPTAPQLSSHYLTPAVPALIVAAVCGLETLVSFAQRSWPKLPAELARAARMVSSALPGAHGERAPSAPAHVALGLGLLLVAAAAGHVVAGGLPGAFAFALGEFRGDPETAVRRAAIARVGATASVQAPDPLLPHLAERRLVHRAPPPERETQFVVLDVAHRRQFARSENLLRTVQEPVVRGWLARSDHRVVFARGDLIVLERGLSPRGGLVRRYFTGLAPPDSGRALTACLAVRGAELAGSQLHLQLVARGPCPHDLAIRFGASPRPGRADLLFDGLLSPANLSRGDALRSTHELRPAERAAILEHGLFVGALRASGARPRPSDPNAIPVRVQQR